mmetsp:Transcript_17115/g.19471  ORF Transcript_17115/g.19471 Transcript_17115/m.19471 type:complete len:209 (-) Transcript_17115:593-1219(-)|eukprot:CAMPEP_0184018072 /NCGR_PEP_ID=MMETSP0954-20121128/7919_1 /TAXON_ID=627963 /ORGANISM="Aplanochytrium sp, Strain PBS07" /LENGTH=208 /DNA_ID=CAMNT_0026299439 /DNA_START=143 /DNA_END=769 /DNA_ORIENTATION=-
MDQGEDPFTGEPTEGEVNEADFDNAFEEDAVEEAAAHDAFEEEAEEGHIDEEAFGDEPQGGEVMVNGGDGFDAFHDDEGYEEVPEGAGQAEEALPMESAALAEFEKEFNAKIAEKDEANKTKREEMKQEAMKELEKFSKEFKMKCETKHSSNKSEEEEFTTKVRDAETNASLNPWERIVTLVDLAEKGEGRDVTRLRNMLIQLKNSKN